MLCCEGENDDCPPLNCYSCNNCCNFNNCCNCIISDKNQRKNNVGEIEPTNDSWIVNKRFKALSNQKSY